MAIVCVYTVYVLLTYGSTVCKILSFKKIKRLDLCFGQTQRPFQIVCQITTYFQSVLEHRRFTQHGFVQICASHFG